ncbi:MAG: 23S rRNA (guanosine(2251)-2'-O)-methyltransferase RlmB [Deltaproteobacteria bacterium]|nr:23S rRNA (guanosine(2251)-2'-O)-methyltransferase RlmB [Deltaproteobacteria bacterium]
MKKQKTEILYGIHPVFEALKAGRRKFYEIYVVGQRPAKRLSQVVMLAQRQKIPVRTVKDAQLKSITGSDYHQGVGAGVSPYPFAGFSDIVDKIQSVDKKYFLLLLDNVLDPHNLGALVRTALGVGIDGIIIPKDRAASPTPAVSKASAGALEHVCLARVTNMVNTVKLLKEKGIWIVGMDRSADKSLYASDLISSVALVVGGEGTGIRPLVKKNCDFLISIPQAGPVDSLNASVAGAVVMYEAFRQRKLCQSKSERIL